MLEKIGAVAYKLDLPAQSLIHPVFHISQLNPFTPNYSPVYKELPKIVDLDVRELQPIVVLERRLVKKGYHAIPQVLVQWEKVPREAATWEDLNVVKTRFPNVVAWGQATSGAGGSVMSVNE